MEKARKFQKNIYLCFIDYAKAFVWIIINCGKLLKRWEYQCILSVSWEICTVKKQQLIGSGLKKEYDRAVCCQPVLFNLYAEHMRNAERNELQAGIKIGREISTTSDKWLISL